MQVCDVVTGTKRLQKSTKALKEQWLMTKEYWRDKTADKYEEEYLQPLGECVRMALSAVDRLTEVLEEAEKDLSDHDGAY
jgi:hypothetical protein